MDILAAHQLKEAILIALLNLSKTGSGSYIDASLFRAGVSSLANQATNWLVGNTIPERMGSDHPNIVPYGTIFSTSDGKGIVIAVGTEKQFQELCEVIGKPELAKDPRYSSNIMRVRNKESIKKSLQDEIVMYDRDTILRLLEDRKIPAGGVFNMKEVFETPEAQNMVLSYIDDPTHIKGVSSIGFNINNQSPENNISPPPGYGEHTFDILEKLPGYNSEIIKRLVQQKIIYGQTKK